MTPKKEEADAVDSDRLAEEEKELREGYWDPEDHYHDGLDLEPLGGADGASV